MNVATFNILNAVVILIDIWLVLILMRHYRLYRWWAFPILLLLAHGLSFSIFYAIDTVDAMIDAPFYYWWSAILHMHDKTTILVYALALLYNYWRMKLKGGSVRDFIKRNNWRLLFPIVIAVPLIRLVDPPGDTTPVQTLPLWIQILGIVVPFLVAASGVIIALAKSPFEIRKTKNEGDKEKADTEATYQEMVRKAAETEKSLRQEIAANYAEISSLRNEFEAYKQQHEADIENLRRQHEVEMGKLQKMLDSANQLVAKLKNYITGLIAIIRTYDPEAVIPDLDPKPKKKGEIPDGQVNV